MDTIKKVIWVGDTLKNLKHFPEEVKDSIGYALHLTQLGVAPKNAKPLKGFKTTVMEIVSDFNTNTFRAVYTVKLDDIVYVLHCFQKKSRFGIKTPKHEIELIKQRLNDAKAISQSREVLYDALT